MSYLIFLFVFAFIDSRVSGMQCGKCPKDFTYLEKEQKCFQAFTDRKTWEGAQKACQALNSHLVIVHDNATFNLIEQFIQQFKETCKCDVPAFWTSGRRECKDGKFAWNPHKGLQVDLKFEDWLPGEPLNHFGVVEDCLELVVVEETFGFNNEACQYERCFICEIDVWK